MRVCRAQGSPRLWLPPRPRWSQSRAPDQGGTRRAGRLPESGSGQGRPLVPLLALY